MPRIEQKIPAVVQACDSVMMPATTISEVVMSISTADRCKRNEAIYFDIVLLLMRWKPGPTYVPSRFFSAIAILRDHDLSAFIEQVSSVYQPAL